MKRILLANKFYYPRGGDCMALLATEQLLKSKGHEVGVFSMSHPQNLASPWESHFAPEISFSAPGLGAKFKAARRLFRPPEVAQRFTRLLNDFRPDVVHLHNIHSYLSPVIAQIAHAKGIRVVWTLHDYKLICPTYSCLRDGKPCELCFADKSNVLKRRCMKNSRAASLMAWLEALYWNRTKLERITDRFVTPSQFLKDKMVSAGFRAEQIEMLHNFVGQSMTPPPVVAGKADYYCYVGRLSEEKGVDTLLRAARQLPWPLKIVGGGPLLSRLKQTYASFPHIEFRGQLSFDQLRPILQQARFSVIPSIWYENNPYSVIESLCLGVPVLGARIGGLPELIDPGRNGEWFTPGNVEELQTQIDACFRRFSDTYDFGRIAVEAQNKFSSDTFYQKLIPLYGI